MLEPTPPVEDADSALARTEAWWREWSGRCTYEGAYRDEVLTLADRAQGDDLRDDGRAHRGADDLAAGGDRRRAQLGLPLLLAARLGARAGGAARPRGYTDEALAFRDFMLRVGTGDPSRIQIMYGIGGERRLTEFELDRAPRLRGLPARPHRQRGVRAVPARRLRRGRRGRCSSAPSCSAGSSRGCGRAGERSSSTSRRSGASPTTGSGRRAARGGTTPTRR